MKKFKSKQILVLGLVALVLIAGYVRWTGDDFLDDFLPAAGIDEPDRVSGISSDEGGITVGTATTTAYFAETRQRKDIARSEAIELLNTIINNNSSTPEARSTAQTQVTNIARNIEREAIIESLIRARGIEEAVVFIDETNVSVVVKSDELDSSTVAQIQDIVIGQTGVRAERIRISSI